MRKLVWLSAGATFVGAFTYSIISLNRWEWNRALFFGLVALVAEVGLAAGLVLRKIDQLTRTADEEREQIRAVLRDTRHQPQRFAWLDPKEVMTRSNVFITMLVGGGVLLSGLAWVIDKIAARTSTTIAEGRLAGDLTRISYPEDGLYVDEVTALAMAVPHFDDPDLRALLRGHR